jgi:hypothetical protein
VCCKGWGGVEKNGAGVLGGCKRISEAVGELYGGEGEEVVDGAE